MRPLLFYFADGRVMTVIADPSARSWQLRERDDALQILGREPLREVRQAVEPLEALVHTRQS